MKVKLFWVLPLLLWAIFLIGCASDSPPTLPPPSPSPEATHTPAATATPEPTSSPTPEPSPTPSPTPEPTATTEAKTWFKIVTTLDTTAGLVTGEVYLLDYYAIELDPVTQEAVVVFDLLQKAWREVSTGEFTRMATCMEWADENADLTRASLATSADEEMKQIVESLLTPNFQVEVSDSGVLTVYNEYLTYEIVPSEPVDEALLYDFYTFDQLNACHKAMVSGQMPPFPQLAVTQELIDRSIFPAEIVLTVTTQGGQAEVRTTNTVVPLTESETAFAQSVLDD